MQWNCHPESLGGKNKAITADFPWATVAALEKKHRCPVVYLSGAVGGLMSNPSGRIFDDAGKELPDGSFEYARRYGEAVAELADAALTGARPLSLAPFQVSAKTIAVPVQNSLYRAASAIGVMKRDAFLWTGDFQSLGDPMTPETGRRKAPSKAKSPIFASAICTSPAFPARSTPSSSMASFRSPSSPTPISPTPRWSRRSPA